MSPRARQAKGKARINAFEALRAEEEKRLPESVEIAIPPGPRLGDVVVQAEGATLVCHRDRAQDVKALVTRLRGVEEFVGTPIKIVARRRTRNREDG